MGPNDDEVFVIEQILDSRFRGGKEYLIKWQGYSSANNSWEPEEGLEQIQGWLKDFDRAEEEKKRNEELEEAIKKLSVPSCEKMNETEAFTSPYHGSRVKRADKSVKVEVEEQEVPSMPQMLNDDQSMLNDKDHFFIGPNIPGSGTSFMETGRGVECACQTLTDDGMFILKELRSIDNDQITQLDINLSTCQDGIASNLALEQEINSLKVEIREKENNIEDLKLKMKSANGEQCLMSGKIIEIENQLGRVLQEKSALEESVIAKDATIRQLELQNGKLIMDCNELEVTRGRLLFENRLKHRNIESVHLLKIKLAKWKTLLRKTRIQLATQKVQHENSIVAWAAKTLQLETDKTEMQIALAVTKEENRTLLGKNSQFQIDNSELLNKLEVTNQDRERLGKIVAGKREKLSNSYKKIEQLYERINEAKSEIELHEEQKVQLREKCNRLNAKYEDLLFEIQAKNPDHEAECNYKIMLTEMEETLEKAKSQHEQEQRSQELKIAMLAGKLQMGQFSNTLIEYSDIDSN